MPYKAQIKKLDYYETSSETDPVFLDRAARTAHYTGFPNRTESTLAWDDGTATLTLGTSSYYNFFIEGVQYNNTVAMTCALPSGLAAPSGLYWFWIELVTGVATLKCDTTVTDHFGKCLVATVYWNTTTNKGILSDERHWMGRDKMVHEYLHDTIGCRWMSGGTLTFPTASTLKLTQCEIADEDLFATLAQATTVKMMYKDTATTGGSTWCWDTGNTTGKKVVTGAEQYNSTNTLTAVPNSNHFATWVFATNNVSEPFIVIIGQRVDVTLANARTNNTPNSLSFGSLPSAEMKLLYRILWKQGTTAALEIADYRSVSNAPVANFTATDHTALANIGTTTHEDLDILTSYSHLWLTT